MRFNQEKPYRCEIEAVSGKAFRLSVYGEGVPRDAAGRAGSC